MRAGSGRASGTQSTKGSKDMLKEAAELGGGDARDADDGNTIVTMRGGGDPDSRSRHRRRVTWDDSVPSSPAATAASPVVSAPSVSIQRNSRAHG
jgi:hypothetical protein